MDLGFSERILLVGSPFIVRTEGAEQIGVIVVIVSNWVSCISVYPGARKITRDFCIFSITWRVCWPALQRFGGNFLDLFFAGSAY